MLVELGLVEQRYKAVCEVLEGATVVDVARRNGVVRQTVHDWLRRYAKDGLACLVDGSSKPVSCPHQMVPEMSRRGFSSSGGSIPAGAHAPSATASSGRGWIPSLVGRRSIAASSATD